MDEDAKMLSLLSHKRSGVRIQMKKFLKALCLLAILCVGYLALTRPRDGSGPAIDNIKTGADKIVNQVTDMYEEYGSAAAKQVDDALGDKIEQADEALDQVTEQADEAIEEAVGSAVEGAKQGFIQSLKESVSEFFENLSAHGDQE